ncbi:hypothetical protein D3C86_1895830 [compost metagenome]
MRWQQQRRHLRIRRVRRQGLIEIHEIAIQIDVILIHPPQVRKPVRIHRMDQQQREAGLTALRVERGIAQQCHLRTRSTKPFGAVRARSDH